MGSPCVNLRYINMGASGVRAVVGALKKARTVCYLDLSNNGLGDQGGVFAVELLDANPHITHFVRCWVWVLLSRSRAI